MWSIFQLTIKVHKQDHSLCERWRHKFEHPCFLHCQEYDVKGQSHFWGSNQPLLDYIEVLSPIVLRGLRPISASTTLSESTIKEAKMVHCNCIPLIWSKTMAWVWHRLQLWIFNHCTEKRSSKHHAACSKTPCTLFVNALCLETSSV
jgi:hypothetical protein